MLLCSCGVQTNGNDPVNNNDPIASNIVTPTNVPQVVDDKDAEISIDNLKAYLNTSKADILKTTGSKDESDTISIVESHMVFPCIFSKEVGLTFVFPDYSDEAEPVCIIVNQHSNKNNVNLKGAKPGMLFKEIKSILGDKPITKSWISTEDNTVYKVDYTLDGLLFSFVSYDQDGNNTELYISSDY